MMKLLILLLIINGFNSEVSQDTDTFDLEYAIGSNDNFEKLTTLNLRKLKESHSSYLAMYQNTQLPTSPTYSVNIYSSLINPTTKNQLLKEFKTSLNPIFRVTSLNSLLASNNIQLNLTLHLNSNNNINSLTIKSDHLKTKETIDESNYYLTINANLLTVKVANSPDTQLYIEKVKKEIEAKKETNNDNNKSFLAKYWYYIVPFVVIMFISSFLNPEQGAAAAS